jgi:multiple sugar transport system substrate-binding protein
MSDVVATQESKYSESALLSASFYNGTTKKRSYYMAPVKQNSAPFHVWSDLVAKAGFKMSDIPERWDDRWTFFKQVHEALRKQGMPGHSALACSSPRSDRTTATIFGITT